MPDMNGRQLYGIHWLLALMRMGRHPGTKKMKLRQRLAMADVTRAGKLTALDGRIYSNTFTPYFPSIAYDRFVDGLRAVSAGRPTPLVTNFAVTAACPCRCWHCSFAGRSPAGDLSLEELTRAISEVQDLGASVIGLTGGEPLLRDDLEDIIAAIGERSMPLLFTTGFHLTPERVRSLKAAGLAIPVISLDHYDRKRHDDGRGKKGMYDQAVAAIGMFREAGFYTAVSFVPDRELVDDADDLYRVLEFFKSLGINDMRLTSPILSGRLTDRKDRLLTDANRKVIWGVQRFLSRSPGYPGAFSYDVFESERYYGCGAGYNYLFIDNQGNACPCEFAMLSYGSIREASVAEIWSSMSEAFSAPGVGCYANRIHESVAALGNARLPLDPAESAAIVEKHPTHDPENIPVFFRNMGLGYACSAKRQD